MSFRPIIALRDRHAHVFLIWFWFRTVPTRPELAFHRPPRRTKTAQHPVIEQRAKALPFAILFLFCRRLTRRRSSFLFSLSLVDACPSLLIQIFSRETAEEILSFFSLAHLGYFFVFFFKPSCCLQITVDRCREITCTYQVGGERRRAFLPFTI